jgi:hypothetical protein
LEIIGARQQGRITLARELKGAKGMKRANNFLVLAAVVFAALISVLAPAASAQTGSVSGVILDVNEKPWAGVTVQAVSDQGF